MQENRESNGKQVYFILRFVVGDSEGVHGSNH